MIWGLINERGSLRSLLLSWLDAKTFKEFSVEKIQLRNMYTMFVIAQILSQEIEIIILL